ncbi:MAG: nuclear transport factor 2 family protein [Alphaproteobacteria bacterium]|nr:nuclear transport factor 2 family protein [Alphaproteobacteria bacterium]
MTPAAIAQKQLDAYNAQDLDAYMACFTPDCVIADLNGAVTQNGAGEIRARYAAMFAKFPQNKAELLHRIAHGTVVIDHERVVRAPGGEVFEAVAIYTVRDGLIARVDFAK